MRITSPFKSVQRKALASPLRMIWRTNDLSPLAYLIPSIAAETATGTGFYYSKAKVENRIKLMKANKVQPNNDNFNDYNSGGIYNG